LPDEFKTPEGLENLDLARAQALVAEAATKTKAKPGARGRRKA
jgi:hypothetical protein